MKNKKSVRFADKLETIKLVTILNTCDGDVDKNRRLADLETLDGVMRENQRLIERLNELEKKRLQGRDVRGELSKLEEQFEIISQIGELMAKKKSIVENKSSTFEKEIKSRRFCYYLIYIRLYNNF